MTAPQSTCPYGLVIDRAKQTERLSREALDEVLAHLLTGCAECLHRAPRSWIELLEASLEDMDIHSRSAAPGPLQPCHVTPAEMDRWFSHRPRVPFPEPAASSLSLPIGERIHALLTNPEWSDPRHLVQLGVALESLVLTQPPRAEDFLQMVLVRASFADCTGENQQLLWHLLHQTVRAWMELSLRHKDWHRAHYYGLWLAGQYLTLQHSGQKCETHNTMALHLLHRGDLENAQRQLSEAVQNAQEADEHGFAGKLLTNAAFVALLDGRHAEAQTLAGRALSLLSQEGALASFPHLENGEVLIQQAEDLLARAADPSSTH